MAIMNTLAGAVVRGAVAGAAAAVVDAKLQRRADDRAAVRQLVAGQGGYRVVL